MQKNTVLCKQIFHISLRQSTVKQMATNEKNLHPELASSTLQFTFLLDIVFPEACAQHTGTQCGIIFMLFHVSKVGCQVQAALSLLSTLRYCTSGQCWAVQMFIWTFSHDFARTEIMARFSPAALHFHGRMLIVNNFLYTATLSYFTLNL